MSETIFNNPVIIKTQSGTRYGKNTRLINGAVMKKRRQGHVIISDSNDTLKIPTHIYNTIDDKGLTYSKGKLIECTDYYKAIIGIIFIHHRVCMNKKQQRICKCAIMRTKKPRSIHISVEALISRHIKFMLLDISDILNIQRSKVLYYCIQYGNTIIQELDNNHNESDLINAINSCGL